jgi:hypothetical protein
MTYYSKYLKYKNKYLILRNYYMIGGDLQEYNDILVIYNKDKLNNEESIMKAKIRVIEHLKTIIDNMNKKDEQKKKIF